MAVSFIQIFHLFKLIIYKGTKLNFQVAQPQGQSILFKKGLYMVKVNRCSDFNPNDLQFAAIRASFLYWCSAILQKSKKEDEGIVSPTKIITSSYTC
jgi:hypothetical protein